MKSVLLPVFASAEAELAERLAIPRGAAQKIGADRVGIRVSPYGAFNGTEADADVDALYEHLATRLGELGLVYIHVDDHSALGAPPVKDAIKQAIRERFRGTYIPSSGYDRARAEHDLAEKRGDLVAFGRPFLANPRLVSKLRSGAALAAPDMGTFFTPGEKGYTGYPVSE